MKIKLKIFFCLHFLFAINEKQIKKIYFYFFFFYGEALLIIFILEIVKEIIHSFRAPSAVVKRIIGQFTKSFHIRRHPLTLDAKKYIYQLICPKHICRLVCWTLMEHVLVVHVKICYF